MPVDPVLALISEGKVSLIYTILLPPFPILLPSSGGKSAPELRCHSCARECALAASEGQDC